MTRCEAAVVMALLALALFCTPVAQAGIQGLQPLDTPAFSNNFPQSDKRWELVLEQYQAGRLEQLELLLTELAAGPHRELALRNLAVVQKELGNNAAAAATLQLLVSANERDHNLWTDLGWTYLRLARPRDAEPAFRRALELEPTSVRALHGLGLALTQRDVAAALSYLQRAKTLDSSNAAVHYTLGHALMQVGRTEEGIEALARAVSLEGTYTDVYPLLAQAYEAKGDVHRAWTYWQRAARTRTRDAAVQAAVNEFISRHEAELRRAELAAAVQRTRVKPLAAEPLTVPGAPTIRVGLVEGARQLHMAWGVPVELRSKDQQTIAQLPAGQVWEVACRDGQIEFRPENGESAASVTAPILIVPTAAGSTITVYDMEMGTGYFYARREHRHYRGSMEIALVQGAMTLVNVVDLESYLLSVVPSEMYTSMPLEALKAQAVAARTYTLRSLGKYRARGFDVIGSVASSEYRGAGVEHPRTTAAVLATAGMVLKAGNQLAETVYSATHGGHSVSASDMWGGSQSYLRGVLDAPPGSGPQFPLGPAALAAWLQGMPAVYASQSAAASRSSFRWVMPVSAADIAARVNARQYIGEVVRVIPRRRAVGGQVLEVDVVGTAGTYRAKGDSVRTVLGGLKSNLFQVETCSDQRGNTTGFIFYGGGWGHGVGMDQLGAAGMAEQGANVTEILQHYYGSARLEQLY